MLTHHKSLLAAWDERFENKTSEEKKEAAQAWVASCTLVCVVECRLHCRVMSSSLPTDRLTAQKAKAEAVKNELKQTKLPKSFANAAVEIEFKKMRADMLALCSYIDTDTSLDAADSPWRKRELRELDAKRIISSSTLRRRLPLLYGIVLQFQQQEMEKCIGFSVATDIGSTSSVCSALNSYA